MIAPYTVGIVIPAGGRGTRFGADSPKQYLLLDGVPIIVRTLRTALNVSNVCAIVIAVQTEEIVTVRSLLQEYGCADSRITVVEGGAQRLESVAKGLAHPTLSHADVVLIHDAVRPLASAGLFDRVAESARVRGAVIPSVAVTDTLKKIDIDGVVIETIDRSLIRRAQTPQGFTGELIRHVYADAARSGSAATDCASLCEQAGIAVHTVDGEESNIKITTPFDLALASLLLAQKSI